MSDALLTELAGVLTVLEAAPDNVRLLRKQCDLLKELSMDEEFIDAVIRLSSLVMLDEATWLSYFDVLTAQHLTPETVVEILERFEQAEADYLSIRILLKHAEFILRASKDDANEMGSFLTLEDTRSMLKGVFSSGVGLINESIKLWNLWSEWEISLLEHGNGSVDKFNDFFLDRIGQPHLQTDETLNAYSSFCTAYFPNEYEERLIRAKAVALKNKKVLEEKRYGKSREEYEQELLYAEPPLQASILLAYTQYETNAKSKQYGKNDPFLARAVFERAISAYARLAVGELAESYKSAEASVWEQYGKWTGDVSVWLRAVRACPQNASLWGHLLLYIEHDNALKTDFEAHFNRCISTAMLDCTGLAEVFISKIAFQRRNDASVDDIFQTFRQGFEEITKRDKVGDPSVKLERCLLEWAENIAPTQLQSALELIARPSKSRQSSYQMAVLKSGVHLRHGDVEAARSTLIASTQRSDLDWPEAIFDALSQLENLYGDFETLTSTNRILDQARAKLAKRRQQSQAYYVPDPQVGTATSNDEVLANGAQPNDEIAEPIQSTTEPAVPDGPVARDREHTSILVRNLPKGIEKSRVESLFESCGRIREIVLPRGFSDTALVEFRDVSSIPDALSRDRRKVDDCEIAVSMLWRSTLFVTNFPREMDDETIRNLFSAYGTILQTRWPARKYADSRRFCYITMDSPASAESARVLHGFRPDSESGFGLTVLVSDPASKTKRSDDNNATLFVGGLNSSSTEDDVRGLFSKYGTITAVKLGWDPEKSACKGYAFVTLSTESEAKACLESSGMKYQNKRLKVEIRDRNHENKKAIRGDAAAERRARSVRLDGLPANTQEGLLQQALEKLVPVKKLEVFTRDNHAVAELHSQADVGSLMLHPEPFVFQGVRITVSDSNRPPQRSNAAPTNAPSFVPRNVPKSSLGKSRGRQPAADKTLAAIVPSVAASQNDFRAMVAAKNDQRKHNLNAAQLKRSAEEDQFEPSKKVKTELDGTAHS